MSYQAWQTLFDLPREEQIKIFTETKKFVNNREKIWTDTAQTMESYLAIWFEKNYNLLGYDKILKINQSRFPDYIMKRKSKELRVELENTTSDFFQHKHKSEDVDVVVCYEKIKDIPNVEIEELYPFLVRFKDIDKKLTELIRPYWSSLAIQNWREKCK